MALEAWTYDPAIPTENLGDYQYKEYRESGSENFAPNASQCTRVFFVAWSVRASFLDDLLGYSTLSGGRIHRVLPDPHPEIDNFYAVDASVEGMGTLGKSANAVSWTVAKITANYRPRPYAVLDDSQVAGVTTSGDNPELHRYTTRGYAFNVEMLSVNGSMKFCTATGTPPAKRIISNPPGKAIGTMALVYTWTEVPAYRTNPFTPPVLTNVSSMLGKVNSTVFDAGGGNYPRGTILFSGIEPKMIMPKLSDDTYYWEVVFSFLYRNNGYISSFGEYAGHNYLFRPEIGWDLLTLDGTTATSRIYEYADLNLLWTLS